MNDNRISVFNFYVHTEEMQLMFFFFRNFILLVFKSI